MIVTPKLNANHQGKKRMAVLPQLIQPVGGVQFLLHEAFLSCGRRLFSVVTSETTFADLRPPFCFFLYQSLRNFE